MPTRFVSARCLTLPENRAAILAIQHVFASLTNNADEGPNPLYLHGPTGTGKTFLVQTLANELRKHGIETQERSANDLADFSDVPHVEHADLLIVEDLQHLPARCANHLLRWIDDRLDHGQAMIFTANVGPGQLKPRGVALPSRLTNRLAGGLVVALEPLQAPSRRRMLTAFMTEAKVTIAADILDWLADRLSGGARQLHGAVRQIKALQRLQARPLCIDDLKAHFKTQTEAAKPTMKRIAEHVSDFYRVKPTHVLSARRSREIVRPRQVSMYLARQLTKLSFEKIGKYFGGRDHKTVQYACKKVEIEMQTDPTLNGAVRQMRAELA
jgi:chromosomal replication initiator protein